MDAERFATVVIGAGQAGLSAGYYLRKAGRSFVILEGQDRVGGTGSSATTPCSCSPRAMGAQAAGHALREQDRALPIEGADGRATSRTTRGGSTCPCEPACASTASRGTVTGSSLFTDGGRFEADNVIVATGANRDPRVPAFAKDARSGDRADAFERVPQPVTAAGRGRAGGRRRQLGRGHLARGSFATHPTWLSGPDRGHIPVSIDTWVSRHVAFRIIRFLGVHVLTLGTPFGRKVEGQARRAGRHAGPREAEAARRRRRRARRQDGRRSRRQAGARGRHGARRVERDLVHGLPPRLLVDRPAGVRRGRRARCTSAASSGRSRVCTSSGSCSSTRRRRT